MDYSIMLFVVNAVIGAFLNVLMWSKSPKDVTSFEAIKTVVVGAIAGYIYWWGHQEHGFPDGMMSVLVGYSSKDFIDWVMDKVLWRPKQGGSATT